MTKQDEARLAEIRINFSSQMGLWSGEIADLLRIFDTEQARSVELVKALEEVLDKGLSKTDYTRSAFADIAREALPPYHKRSTEGGNK